MNPARRRFLHRILTILVLVSMGLGYLMPFASLYAARAQEATSEPTVETTPEPTPEAVVAPEATPEPVVESTVEPTVEATVEATAEPTVETTLEPTIEPTSEATDAPATPENPLTDSAFLDDFQDGEATGWVFNGTWYVTGESGSDNLFLSAVEPNVTAALANVNWANLLLSADVRVAPGNTFNLSIGSGHTITLDAAGNASLWRDGVQLAPDVAAETATEEAVATWRVLNVHALGGTITVGVNGLVQFTYTDPTPLAEGAVFISTGATNSGEVAIDNITVNKLDAPVAPEVTVEPELTPEATVEPEVTPEATAEPEVTEEPVAAILAADFEGETLDGWTLTGDASVIQESDSNKVLSMLSGASLVPANPLYLGDFQLDARVNLAAGSLSIPFRTQEGMGYVLTFDAAQTALSRTEAVVTEATPEATAEATEPATFIPPSNPIAHEAGVWHTLSLSVIGGEMTVTVDDVVEWTAVDTSPILSGQIAFVANADSNVMLDDISIIDLGTSEVEPTATPIVLTEEGAVKLDSAIVNLLNEHLSGNEAGVQTIAADFFMKFDEANRLNVVVWSVSEDAAAATALIETTGGVIDSIYEGSLNARVSLIGLVALANHAEISNIQLPVTATSTSSTNAPAASNTATGSITPHSLDIVGANDWHTAGFRGQGVKVAVIDTGFSTSGSTGTDRSCLDTAPNSGSTHGIAMVEVICDIAPNASVRGYIATDANSLKNQVNAARSAGYRVIVIAIDLGASVSAGDGVDGPGSAGVYAALAAARAAGVLVIAAAGNNNGGGSLTLAFTGGTMSIPVTMYGGDRVNVSWNDWDDPSPLSVSVSGTTGATLSGGAIPRSPSASSLMAASACETGCETTVSISGSGSYTVQLQIAGRGRIDESSLASLPIIDGDGNLARPADSPDVVTVAAVCAAPDFGYPVLPDSSHGPIFAPGGGAPLQPDGSRNTVKPDIAAPANVSTSVFGATEPCVADTGDGFTGTSAAAAHVAGMAALLISNTNPSMNAFDSGTGAANALKNYMQTHTADLFADLDNPAIVEPNGFDYRYGAGMFVLGDPNYDLSKAVNPAVPAISDVLYVGQGNLDSLQTGTPAHPYLHISAAVTDADPGERVVVLPGEYVTPLYMSGEDVEVIAYNSDSGFATGNDSEIWVNSSSGRATETSPGNYSSSRGGAVFVFNSLAGVSLEGFVFKQADPLGNLFGPGGQGISRANGIEFNNVIGGGISDASFTTFFNSIPVVVNNSGSVEVLNSVFEGNNGDGQSASALLITGSESGNSGTPILVQGNTFQNNSVATLLGDIYMSSVIIVENSAADIYSNVFTGNAGESVIGVRNDGIAYEDGVVNMYSNLIFYNTGNLGPVISLDPAPRARFNNNTVVGHSLSDSYSLYQGVLTRGAFDALGPLTTPPHDAVGSRWDIRNNIFYNNPTFDTPVFDATDNSGCASLDTPIGADNGARRNWVFNSGSTNVGDCFASFANVAFNNITTPDPFGSFVGPTLNPPLLSTDPLFYQIKQGDTIAIDNGDMTALTPNNPALVHTVVDDAKGNPRVSDGNPLVDPAEVIEIGAMELTPLTAFPLDTDRTEDQLDNLSAFRINLADAVEGGFPPLTFTVKSYPQNYGTDTGDTCGGQGLVIIGNFAYYCPPKHFYTHEGDEGAPGTQIVDPVTFEFNVTDNTNSPLQSAPITMRIFESFDNPLANPSDQVQYRFLARIDEVFDFHLRPFVRFNNFRLSERGTPGLEDKAQYPYSYGTIAVLNDTGQEGYNPFLFSDDTDPVTARAESQAYISAQVAAATGTDKLISLDPQPSQLGFLRFTYRVTDADGGFVDNEIRIEVVGTIPDRGLHDDTSFNFKYSNDVSGGGAWSPIYNEAAINNTLHQSKLLNDKASFDFIGEGFVLYMGATSAAGLWELKVDDNQLNWALINGEWRGTTAGESYTCTTRQLVNPTLKQINGKGSVPYTVSCRGLRDGEAHAVEIINRQANKLVIVDAFSIIFESDPLLPGIHDVNEPDVLPNFVGWSLLSDKKASRGIALQVTSAPAPEVHFSFIGSGFSLGTMLQGWGKGVNFAGANYTICVTPGGGDEQEFCQPFTGATGATTKAVYNVFRPFVGFDPNEEHEVRLIVNSIPAGGRMVVDSIRVFDDEPTQPLALGVNENDEIGTMVFNNGLDDSWVFNTRTAKASNSSLHTMNTKAIKAGPFVQFEIPDEATMFVWNRLKTTADSQLVRVCVDLGQGENGITVPCQTYDLRNVANNPLIVRETDFGGWGDAWGTDTTHSVQIYSVTNQPFSVDSVQVFSAGTTLAPGMYDDLVFGQNTAAFKFSGAFSRTPNARTSFGAFSQTSTQNAYAFARFNGTGFSAAFLTDKFAGNVEICYAPGLLANADAIIAATETCRSYNNFSGGAMYGVTRVFAGLTPGDYSVFIRNTDAGKTMKFDTFEVFGDLPGTVLEPGDTGMQVFETSFVNRAADDLFTYIGTGWKSVATSAAKAYSGGNYDQISAKIGAGIVFSVENATHVQILRPAGTKYAPLEICIDGTAACTYPANTLDPIIVQLPDTNLHEVSVTTMWTGAFILDAVVAYSGLVMEPGTYEDNSALLTYDAGPWTNLNGAYTQGHGKQTTALDADVIFSFTGTDAQVALFVAALNQVEICYVTGVQNDPELVNANCQFFPTVAPFAGRQLVTINPSDTPATYTVRVRNKIAAKKLILDYVVIADGTQPLIEGRHESQHPKFAYTGTWTEEKLAAFSGGSAHRTSIVGNSVDFDFVGTGFEVAIPTGRFGSEVQVCYETGALPFDGTSDICYTYQHETAAVVNTVTRSVNGLTDSTYSVRITLLDENGSLFGATRSPANAPTLKLDYVTIFDDSFVEVAPGVYDDDAVDANGDRLLTLSPANRWTTITGSAAAKFSGGSYATVVDDTKRLSNKYAGPVASLNVEVPAASSLSIVLTIGTTSARNPLEMLACFQNVDSVTPNVCSVITTMRTNKQQVYTINNAGGAPLPGVVTFRALTPGEFTIDGFQIIEGSVLAEGMYDDKLASTTAGSLVTLSNTGWTTAFRNTKAFGGTMARAQANGSSFTFDFSGTGFGFMTQQFTGGVDLNICYEALPVTGAVDANCIESTTDQAKGSLLQASIVKYGLPEGEYRVQVTIDDTTINVKTDWLYLDAVIVFGALTDALEPGFYDQTQLPVESASFGPQPNWTTAVTRYGPTAGHYGLSDVGATNMGSVAQMNVAGNGMILYQSISSKNSSYVQVCLVIEGTLANELQCSNFSQNGRTTWFAPIALYGFGSGEHTIIFENRWHGRRFNVDAVRVLP